MTPLTDTADRTGGIPIPPTGRPKWPPAHVLADPRVRLGTGAAALLVTAVAARRNRSVALALICP